MMTLSKDGEATKRKRNHNAESSKSKSLKKAESLSNQWLKVKLLKVK